MPRVALKWARRDAPCDEEPGEAICAPDVNTLESAFDVPSAALMVRARCLHCGYWCTLYLDLIDLT